MTWATQSRKPYRDEALHIEEPWAQMCGFEGVHSLGGVPGSEGGKEPDHTTAPCTVAVSNAAVFLKCFWLYYCP